MSRWTAVAVALVVPFALGAGLAALAWRPEWGGFVFIPAMLAALVVAWQLVALVRRVEARAQRRWLDELDLPLDRGAYLALLARKRYSNPITMRVELAAEPAPEDRQLVRRVVTGATPGATAAWRGAPLTITTPTIETRDFNNVRIHRWFRRFERDALRPLARAFPLASITVADRR